MLSFLSPFLLFLLPLAALPWFWPDQKKPPQTRQPFSSFFLLPKTSYIQRWQWSTQHWWLKLLRSLILLGIILLLAKPSWTHEPPSQQVWILDDTASAHFPHRQEVLQQYWQSLAPQRLQAEVFTLSELFSAPNSNTLQKPSFDKQPAAFSPSLADISQQLERRYQQQDIELQVHLVSDFQSSQYKNYPNTHSPFEWYFHALGPDSDTPSNLALSSVQAEVRGNAQVLLNVQITGATPSPTPFTLTVLQEDQTLLTHSGIWKETLQVPLQMPSQWNRTKTIKLVLDTDLPDATWDNQIWFQWSSQQHPWIGILTSEGLQGVYQYGLHALKAALNANHYISALLTQPEALQQFQPEILILLGDFPKRWNQEPYHAFPKLFIPSRFPDWSNWSVLVKGQHTLQWDQTPLGKEWELQKTEEDHLWKASATPWWFLHTGLSANWGPWYQDASMAETLKEMIQEILHQQDQHFLGNLENWMGPLPKMVFQQSHNAKPPGPQQVESYHWVQNIPAHESQLAMMSHDEVLQMQEHFEHQKPAASQSQVESAEQWKWWLLWIVLGLLFLEITATFFTKPAS